MIEKWEDIKGLEGLYQISNMGRVRNLRTGLIRKQIIGTTGYYATSFFKSNQEKYFKKIHVLVAIAFVSNPHNKPCVNHIDGNKLNNKAENLEWCTHKENSQHAIKILNKLPGSKGEKSHKAKLTETQVMSILLEKDSISERKLAIKYGVSRRAIRSIKSGYSWKHILRTTSDVKTI